MSTAADALEAIAKMTAPQWTITRKVASADRASFLVRTADGQHFDVTIRAPKSRQDTDWALSLSRATVANRHGIPLVSRPVRTDAIRPVVVADDLLFVIRSWVADLATSN